MQPKKSGKERLVNDGYLYCFTSKFMPNNYFKLGFTTDLDSRLRNYRTSHIEGEFKITLPSCPITNSSYCPTNNKPETKLDAIGYREKALFKMLDRYRVSADKEFFMVDFEVVAATFAKLEAMTYVEVIMYLENLNDNSENYSAKIAELENSNIKMHEDVLQLKIALRAKEEELQKVKNQVNLAKTKIANIETKTYIKQIDELKAEIQRLQQKVVPTSSSSCSSSASSSSSSSTTSVIDLTKEIDEISKILTDADEGASDVKVKNETTHIETPNQAESLVLLDRSEPIVETQRPRFVDFSRDDPIISTDVESLDKSKLQDELATTSKSQEEKVSVKKVKPVPLMEDGSGIDPLRCMVRTCTDRKPYQCKYDKIKGEDICTFHKNKLTSDPPCTFSATGEKLGWFYGRVDQECPIFTPSGELAIPWTYPQHIKSKIEIEVLKGAKWHPFSDRLKRSRKNNVVSQNDDESIVDDENIAKKRKLE